MKKNEMIDIIRFEEAISWERLKEFELNLQKEDGSKAIKQNWTASEKFLYERLLHFWVCKSELCIKLKIVQYSFLEREHLHLQYLTEQNS